MTDFGPSHSYIFHEVLIRLYIIFISPLPLEGYLFKFDELFILLKWCTEPITEPGRLKVNVIVESYGI